VHKSRNRSYNVSLRHHHTSKDMAQDIVFEIDSLCYVDNSTNRPCSDPIHPRPQPYSFPSLRIEGRTCIIAPSMRLYCLIKPLLMP
jgi:hypothetical protein